MRTFRATPIVLGASLAAVSVLHLALGLGADRLLGAGVVDAVVRDPGLASQNRFFGVTYGLYAVVLWLAARDIDRYRPVLTSALVITMLGGFARLIPWVLYGPAPPTMIGLFVTEVLIPPVLLFWLHESGARHSHMK